MGPIEVSLVVEDYESVMPWLYLELTASEVNSISSVNTKRSTYYHIVTHIKKVFCKYSIGFIISHTLLTYFIHGLLFFSIHSSH